MTKDELKTLSDSSFYDNNVGGIQPSAHREFNNELMDFITQLATSSEAGMVKSSTNELEVNVDPVTGNMSIPGLIAELEGKQDKAEIISINNFDTFSTSSISAIAALGPGESIPVYGVGAIGSPPTQPPANAWAGVITRISGAYYRIIVFSNGAYDYSPQTATRLYSGGPVSTWQLSTDNALVSSNGYTKLPSGIMIQWGTFSGSNNTSRTYSFPVAFRAVFAVIPCENYDSPRDHILSAPITGKTVGNFTVRIMRIPNEISSLDTISFNYIAVGTWK